MRPLTALLLMTLTIAAAAAADPEPVPAQPTSSEPARPILQWNIDRALGPAPDAVLLAPVEVTGQRDAFRESDQRLKKAVSNLPCTGCGGEVVQEKAGVVEKVLTGTADVLKAQFVAPENAGEPDSIEDRASAEALDRPLIRPGQDP